MRSCSRTWGTFGYTLAATAVRVRHRGLVGLLSTADVARELGVSRRTVARWVERGWVTPAVTLPGGAHRFRLEDVVEELRALQKKGREE